MQVKGAELAHWKLAQPPQGLLACLARNFRSGHIWRLTMTSRLGLCVACIVRLKRQNDPGYRHVSSPQSKPSGKRASLFPGLPANALELFLIRLVWLIFPSLKQLFQLQCWDPLFGQHEVMFLSPGVKGSIARVDRATWTDREKGLPGGESEKELRLLRQHARCHLHGVTPSP